MSSINEALQMKGELIITKTSETGQVEVVKIPNLVVSAGKTFIMSRVASNTSPVMSHMAVGEGTTSPVLGNTGLETELARVAVDTAGGVASANTVAYSATFSTGVGTGALTEAGIFNASSSGTMLCRTTFPVLNKGSNDTISISWVVSIT